MSSKKLNSQLATELENLINNKIDTSYFPYVQGKSIRIGHIIVRETKSRIFLVFDTKENKEIAKMFCKTSALALARQTVKKQNCLSKIQQLDDIISKNYNDAIFHKHTMRITKDSTKFFVAQTRYDIAAERTKHAKEELDSYIYI